MTMNQPGTGDVPPWRGFHHVALVTPDLDATILFYGEILGMRVGDVFPATQRQGRHCFVKPGGTETDGLRTSSSVPTRVCSPGPGHPSGSL